jgi:hypothetical protein
MSTEERKEGRGEEMKGKVRGKKGGGEGLSCVEEDGLQALQIQ